MQRRKFLAAATAAGLPLALGATAGKQSSGADDRQLIELRTYEIKFGGGGQSALVDYLTEVLGPTLRRLGCADFRLMREYGQSNPAKLWVLISYPDAETYVRAQDLSADAAYREAAADYDALPASKPVYNGFTSQLLLAFTGMPRVADPGPDAGLFELRTYEGYSEDAVRRKIKMFNDEELPLFDKTGLHRVFFGKMISGPYRPSLVYMLHFKDMEERDRNWSTFGNHPEWKAMVVKPEYADSVSNIRREFLVGM